MPSWPLRAAVLLWLVLPTVLSAQSQLFNSNVIIVGHVNACVTGPTSTPAGPPTAYACTLDRAITQYTTKACTSFVADIANTGAATLNLHSLGAKTIKKVQGGITTDLAANDIRAGAIVTTCYDGTNMQCQNCTGNAATGSGTPGGSSGQAQYNNAGAFGGTSGQSFDASQVLSLKWRPTTVTASATLTTADGPLISCNPPGATDVTLTLPAASSTTQGRLLITKGTTNAGQCIASPNGSDTINFVNGPKAITQRGEALDLALSSATNWLAQSGKTAIDLTTDVTNLLPIANGGTGRSSGLVPLTVAAGTVAMPTAAITTNSCGALGTVTTTSGTLANVLATDVLVASFNGDPIAITGYVPSTNGMLTLIAYPGAGSINIKACNNLAASVTPGSLTLNWRVTR